MECPKERRTSLATFAEFSGVRLEASPLGDGLGLVFARWILPSLSFPAVVSERVFISIHQQETRLMEVWV